MELRSAFRYSVREMLYISRIHLLIRFAWAFASFLFIYSFAFCPGTAQAADDRNPPSPADEDKKANTSTKTPDSSPFFEKSSIPYVPVGSARTKKTVIAFPDIRLEKITETSLAKTIFETVRNDLQFMDLFNFLDRAAFVENPSQSGIIPKSFKFSDWKKIGADFLIKSSLSLDEPNKTLALETYLYDIQGEKQVLAKRYLAPIKDVRAIAHTF